MGEEAADLRGSGPSPKLVSKRYNDLMESPLPVASQNRFLARPRSMLERFVHTETSGSVLLFAATVAANGMMQAIRAMRISASASAS